MPGCACALGIQRAGSSRLFIHASQPASQRCPMPRDPPICLPVAHARRSANDEMHRCTSIVQDRWTKKDGDSQRQSDGPSSIKSSAVTPALDGFFLYWGPPPVAPRPSQSCACPSSEGAPEVERPLGGPSRGAPLWQHPAAAPGSPLRALGRRTSTAAGACSYCLLHCEGSLATKKKWRS